MPSYLSISLHPIYVCPLAKTRIHTGHADDQGFAAQNTSWDLLLRANLLPSNILNSAHLSLVTRLM